MLDFKGNPINRGDIVIFLNREKLDTGLVIVVGALALCYSLSMKDLITVGSPQIMVIDELHLTRKENEQIAELEATLF